MNRQSIYIRFFIIERKIKKYISLKSSLIQKSNFKKKQRYYDFLILARPFFTFILLREAAKMNSSLFNYVQIKSYGCFISISLQYWKDEKKRNENCRNATKNKLAINIGSIKRIKQISELFSCIRDTFIYHTYTAYLYLTVSNVIIMASSWNIIFYRYSIDFISSRATLNAYRFDHTDTVT